MQIERLAPNTLELTPFAERALAGTLDIQGLVVPRSLAELPAIEARHDVSARRELVAAWSAGLSPLNPHQRSREALEQLQDPRALVVVTGQQPGFLCSPLYCLYKALTAISLARALQAAWSRPVIPVFWNHADDHDLAEVHHAFVQNANLDVQRIGLPGLSSGRLSFSQIVLSEGAQGLTGIGEQIASSLPPGAHISAALELLLPRDGETLARAFSRSLSRMLEEQGLLILEPDWVREPLSRFLELAFSETDVAAALAQGAERVRAAGFAVPIEPVQAAVCFVHDERGRRAVRSSGSAWLIDGDPTPRTAQTLAREIAAAPARFSAGALLRPLAQDYALPVAAYVGGWAELGYHAELVPLRNALGVPSTPFVPRASCTLVDPETARALDRLGVSLVEALRLCGKLPEEAPSDAPPVVDRLLAAALAGEAELKALADELAALDRGLAQNLKRAAAQGRSSIDAIREKVLRVHQNQQGKGRRHLRRVQGALFPREEPQERVLGPLDFIARFGRGWIDALGSAIDPFDPRHVVLHLDGPPNQEQP